MDVFVAIVSLLVNLLGSIEDSLVLSTDRTTPCFLWSCYWQHCHHTWPLQLSALSQISIALIDFVSEDSLGQTLKTVQPHRCVLFDLCVGCEGRGVVKRVTFQQKSSCLLSLKVTIWQHQVWIVRWKNINWSCTFCHLLSLFHWYLPGFLRPLNLKQLCLPIITHFPFLKITFFSSYSLVYEARTIHKLPNSLFRVFLVLFESYIFYLCVPFIIVTFGF